MLKKVISKKFSIIILTLFFMILCLGAITTAAIYQIIQSDKIVIDTNKVQINLNNGEKVFLDTDLFLEPGASLTKEFFVTNDGDCDVYYGIYFSKIEGVLVNHLEVTIKTKEKQLFTGSFGDLANIPTQAFDDIMEASEKKYLEITVHMPEDANNELKNAKITFSLNVLVTQVKNNPNRLFQ